MNVGGSSMRVILIKYGELSTKKGNRNFFINTLYNNVKSKLGMYDVSINKSEFYKLLIAYIDDSHFDDMSKAYIYPKVLHYLYECMDFSKEDKKYQKQFLH